MPYKPDPDPAPAHRPLVPIDWNKVDRLLQADCKGTEIAGHLGIHPNTFYHRVEVEKGCGFTEYSSSKKLDGDALLRASQYQKAMTGNTTMQIWLGKQRLGQKDHEDTKYTAPNDSELTLSLNLIKENQHLKDQIKDLRSKIEDNGLEFKANALDQSGDEAV